MAETARHGLLAELDRWAHADLRAPVWLRDDDATRLTDRLDRLLALAEAWRMPLLLAVIPEPAEAALAERLADEAMVRPAVHGVAHRNHAREGAKSTELTEALPERRVDDVIGELAQAHRRLKGIFGAKLSGILVPPWNRLSAGVAARVGEAGFSAISGFGQATYGSRLPVLNTHVDVMNWKGGRVGHDPETVFAMATAALEAARKEGGAPVGLLTHHLAHDETAWAATAALLETLAGHPATVFAGADDLLAARSIPPQPL